jgi:MtN3 and saliva related transmembrane protein
LHKRSTEFLGLAAGAITTVAYVPQIITVWQQKPLPATTVSFSMYAIVSVGIFGWLLYGIRLRARPVIIWNAISFVFAVSILAYKCLYG